MWRIPPVIYSGFGSFRAKVNLNAFFAGDLKTPVKGAEPITGKGLSAILGSLVGIRRMPEIGGFTR